MVKEFREDHLINVLIKNDEKRVKNLMTRAKLELEDQEYQKAEELTEKALELEPKFSEAYILKLLVLLKVSDEKAMVTSVDRPLTEYKEYNRALRFALEEDRDKILAYNCEVLERFEEEENEKIYQRAKAAMHRAVTEEDYEAAAAKFESIPEYKEALELCEEARRLGDAEKKGKVYLEAAGKMELAKEKEKSKEMEMKEVASLLQEAGQQFHSIEDYKDSKERKETCEEESLRLKQEVTYQKAIKKKQEDRREEEYQETAKLFYSISGYKDADIFAKECEEQGKKAGAQYLETLLKKRRRKKVLKKAVLTTVVVIILVVAILGGLTNFTYSLEEYHNLQQGQEEYLWQEAFEQIKNWLFNVGNIF